MKMLRSILSICFLFCLYWPAKAGSFIGRVVSVADGDTLTLLDSANREQKIRLNGIDAPEMSQPFGDASKRNLSDLVYNKNVIVITSKLDKYERWVGTVMVGSTDAGLEQLKAGLAWYFRQYESDVPEIERVLYAAAEAEAKAGKRGLWDQASPQAPWEYRHPAPAPVTSTAVTPSATTRPIGTVAAQPGGMVRGNKNSMIYHAPNCPDYDRIAERNRVPFKTEAEAQAAGYRKARNCP